MRKSVSLRARLLLGFGVVLLLAMLLSFFSYKYSMGRDVEEEARANAVGRLDLAYWLIEQPGEYEDVEALQERMQLVAGKLDVRLTMMASGGQIVADSSVPLNEIAGFENFAGRPEVIMARSHGVGVVLRFSGTQQRNMVFAAREIKLAGVVPDGVLRLAVPVPSIKDRFDIIEKTSVVVSLAAAVIGGILLYRLFRRLRIALRTMVDACAAILRGEYRHRIRVSPCKEFDPLVQAFNQMVEAIEARLLSVTEQKQRTEAILDGMREGVMVLDSKGRILMTNRAMEKLVPTFAHSIGRKPLEAILNPELQAACDKVLSGSPEFEGRPFNLQISMGMDRLYDVNIVQLREERRGMGAILVFHDIGELHRLEKVRQDFVANVSHELRTPLTSIKGYAETLLSVDSQDEESRRTFLGVILKNANHMNKIVEDLLQLARLEAAQGKVNFTPVNASGVLEAAWEACLPIADARGVRLDSSLPEDGVWVEANPDQLLQVFINLLDNAVKYSPEGGAISISCKNGNESGTVTFSVTDEGPGIPKGDQQRIFERFYRVEKHRTVQTGSSGLGLAICRHIIRNHGGSIWVESPPEGKMTGTGLLFTLSSASGN